MIGDSFSTLQWILLLIASMCVGISRTSIIAIGGLSSAIFIIAINNISVAAGIALPLLIVGDLIAIIYYRKHIYWKVILPLFPWIMMGVIIAHFTEAYLNADIIKKIVAYFLLGFLVLSFIKIEKLKNNYTWLAGFFGIIAGFTSMLANAAGPIMSIYLLLKKVDKIVFVSSSAWFFAFMNIFKLFFRISSSTINKASLLVDIKLVGAVLLGAYIGTWFIKIIPEKAFKNLVMILTFIVTIQLLLK